MLDAIKNEANKTFTENGAATLKSTLSDCLDLFAVIGALRFEEKSRVIDMFTRAYAEDADIAMKTLFFGRDIRGGLGERDVFRIILRELAFTHSSSVIKNLDNIAEYGRYDDLLVLLGTPCKKAVIGLIKNQLAKDVEACNSGKEISLLAKWLPSVNTSGKKTVNTAKYLAKKLNMTEESYRKTLSQLRAGLQIIENNLRCKDYTFDYSKQPSRAMLKYRNAFIKHDYDRYNDFLFRVESGEATLHTGTLYPYDIVSPILHSFSIDMTEDKKRSLNASWNSLEDFTNNQNSIAVVDGSGSMYGGSTPAPIDVAISLGIYFAERNKGVFHNHFITFSRNPALVEIKGTDIVDKVKYCSTFCEVANTNIQKVFELILNAAVNSNAKPEELPSTIYIITDMEFDYCTDDADVTNFEYAKKLFEQAGYILPNVVFWNVESRNNQQPVKINEQGAALVSGASPRLFSMIKNGKLTPYDVMMDILLSERYSSIKA